MGDLPADAVERGASDDQQAPSPHERTNASAHAIVGYQTAVALMTYEGSLVWSKFNAMLVANSVVVAVLAGAISQQVLPDLTLYALSFGGLVMSAVWGLLTKRGFDNYIYWILSARELEEQYLSPVTVLSMGGTFADGREVSRLIGNSPRALRMSALSRQFRAATLAYVAIGLFAAIFIALGCAV